MVRRTLRIITSKVSGLHEAAFWLATFSILSQVLAFLRDRLLAHYFGASRVLDIYYASFEVPDLIFTTAASIVSASILIPLLARWDHEENQNRDRHINSVFSAFFGLLVLSCAAAWFLMPYLVPLFFKGLGESGIEQVISFSRLLLLSPLFLGLSNFFGSISQHEKRFLLYSLSPLLYNVGIILGALLGANNFGVLAVVVGVVSGAFLHMGLQAAWVFSSGHALKFIKNIDWREVGKTFSLSVPRTISLSASSLVGLVFVAIASKFPSGSIAAYTFSFNLQSVPLVIIGASYSLAAFPTLAAHFVKKEITELAECLSAGMRHIIFWSLPAAALFIVLRAHIVRVILGSGAFDWSDTRITAAALSIFAFSTVFQSFQLFLTRAYYAFNKTKLPLMINATSAVLTIILAFIFSSLSPEGWFFAGLAGFLKVEGFQRLIVLSLPAAFSLGAAISAFFLWYFLGKEIRQLLSHSLAVTFRDSFLAALSIGAVSWIALRFLDNIFTLTSGLGVFLNGALAGLAGIGAGAAVLRLMKNRELQEIAAKICK